METHLSRHRRAHCLLHAFGDAFEINTSGAALRQEQTRPLVREQLILPDLASEAY